MQEFHTALLTFEVIIKLHTVSVLSVLEAYEQTPHVRHAYDLSRANGLGAWTAALRNSLTSAQPLIVVGEDRRTEWLSGLRLWLSTKLEPVTVDQVGRPVFALAAALGGEDPTHVKRGRNPLGILDAIVEVRNKTTAHHAYDREFWGEHLPAVLEPLEWLTVSTPLWKVDLVLPVRSMMGYTGRLLRGVEPTSTLELPESHATLSAGLKERSQLLFDRRVVCAASSFMHVSPSDNATYFFNGGWRDSDSSAEFLCHAIAAHRPGEGTRRIELAELVVRPPELPPSETEGGEHLTAIEGIALNNLPPEPQGYVRRRTLEDRLGAVIRDTVRRHVINVRGIGGIGKTSLVLKLCHELVLSSECPYDAVVWISARDIDLTVRGAQPVRRGSDSLAEVWLRFSRLFEEGNGVDDAREYFETAMSSEAYLLVLDNFETFDDQAEAYAYLDELVRPPSKVVITSRHVFSGDYAVPVTGMEMDEARELLLQAARTVGSEPAMKPEVISRIFERSQGHPYAMKLIASHLRTVGGAAAQLESVLRQDDLLDALFRRSIEALDNDDDAEYVFLLVGQFSRGVPEAALRVAAGWNDLDLDRAIDNLVLRSLVELDQAASHPRYTMPAMAREFARRKLLIGHVMQTQVLTDRDRLRRWPALLENRNVEAGEQMLADLQATAGADSAHERVVLSALRSLAEADGYVWPSFARASRAAGLSADVWESAYKRALEENPERIDVLWEWSDASPSYTQRIELKVQAILAGADDLALLSRVSAILNNLYARERGLFTQVKWSSLMRPVIDALERRFSELDGEALSRLAWLYIHAGRAEGKAARAVARGLEVEPDNEAVLKLASRLRL